ncbi:Hypothetical protein AA314_01667 [Archangium gephyra]|uniref:Uncharacterized protein n=1 Tax=Archangium gephyra TaxID=48 RepID=A0AAC8Q327_9BACT|nr:Hypothetical protein AA314_01667 [Archangium gephyra]
MVRFSRGVPREGSRKPVLLMLVYVPNKYAHLRASLPEHSRTGGQPSARCTASPSGTAAPRRCFPEDENRGSNPHPVPLPGGEGKGTR